MDLIRSHVPGRDVFTSNRVHFPPEESHKRPGEERPKMLSFPSTRSVLWDQRPKGQPTLIHLTEYRNPLLVLEEKTLWLMQRFAAQDAHSDTYRCLLLGSVASDPDGEGVQISIDRMDPNVGAAGESTMPGELSVQCLLKKNAARSDLATVQDYSTDIKALHQRVLSKDKVDLGRFLSLRAYCSYHVNNNNHIFHIDIDLATLAVSFMATPVSPVPVVPTALSKNLSGPLSLSELQGEPKTGYLTMDHTRKLLLVLESDPKVASLPLVGIWLSGVHSIHDPFVWASCLRYLYNSSLQDRVCRPPEAFLVVLYSPLHSQPEFYNCVTSDSKTALKYSLHTCHEIVSLPKDSPVRPRSPLEVELIKTEHGNKMEIFQSALQENADLMASPSAKKPGLASSLSGSMEEIVPRSTPMPHHSKGFVSMIRPAVPEVSLLLDENEHQQPRPQPHPHPAGHAPVPQPPYPAAFKEKKSKKKAQASDSGVQRGPLKTVNGVQQYSPLQGGYNPMVQQGQWGVSGAPQGYSTTPPHPVQAPTPSWTPQQWAGQAPVSLPQPGPHNMSPQYHPAIANTTPQGYNTGPRGGMSMSRQGQFATSQQPQYSPHSGGGMPQAALPPQQYQARPQTQHTTPVPQNYMPNTSYPNNAQFNQSLPVYSSQGPMGPPPPVMAHSQSLPHQAASSPALPPHGQYRLPTTGPSYGQYPTPPQQQQHPHASPSQVPAPPPSPYAPPVSHQGTPRPPGPPACTSRPPGYATSHPQHLPPHLTPHQSPVVTNHQTPPQTIGAGDAPVPASNENTPIRSHSQSNSTKTSPVSAAAVGGGIVDGAQVPPEVYELLKQQDSQLKALRGQLEQLLSKQNQAEQLSKQNQAEQDCGSNTRELTSTATQSSAHASPVKQPRNVAEMAVNTSLWWPGQIQDNQNSHRDLNASNTATNAQVFHEGRSRTINQSQDHTQTLNQSRDNTNRLHDNSYSNHTNVLNQSHRSHNTTQASHHTQQTTLNQSHRSSNHPLNMSNQQHHSPPQRNTTGQQRLTPPRPSSNTHSPSHGVQDPSNQTLSNETCSLSELQLANLHDRTEDSYISMVVDMPGCPSLSPEKSPHGGSSGYGDTDDSNRSPELGESVSMYEQNRHHDDTIHGTPTGTRTINQSKDTGLGDSHPQVSLLYRNQHEFYQNILGNVKKFLNKHSEEESSDTQPPPSQDDREEPCPAPTRKTRPPPRPEIEKSIDVVAQTREQLKRLGINTEDFETHEQTFRNDNTIMFDPRLLPKISYVSMMLDSDSDLSADADSLAMKYLSDDQLAELAKMRLSGMRGKQKHKHDSALDRMILRTNCEESTYSHGSNHLSFASKKYMERYGLLDDGSGRVEEYDYNQTQEEVEVSTIDPAILNAKAVLERLKETSFLNGTAASANRRNSSSSHSSHSSRHESHSMRSFGDQDGQHHSVTSDTTAYHSPNHTPHHSRERRGASQSSDRSMESTHSAPSGPSSGIRVFNNSANSRQTNFKADRQQFNFSHRSQPPESRPGPGDRILDIGRLKELPKLL